MAMQAQQKLVNVISSLENYLSTGFGSADVQWPDVPFSFDEVSSWYAISYLDIVEETNFQNGDATTGAPGTDWVLLLQISCFARDKVATTGVPVNRRQAHTMADVVNGLLPLNKEINIYDYASLGPSDNPASLPVVDTMYVNLTKTDFFGGPATATTATPMLEGVRCDVVTVELRWSSTRNAA